MTSNSEQTDWTPKRGEPYWYFETYDIIKSRIWIPTYWDIRRQEFGNVFRSFEEAMQVLEELRSHLP